MESIYPAGSIVRAGGKLAYGADWPVGGANPLEGLEVAMTRRTAGDPAARPLIASEGVSLAEAIESHTINVAYVNGMDRFTGSIVSGQECRPGGDRQGPVQAVALRDLEGEGARDALQGNGRLRRPLAADAVTWGAANQGQVKAKRSASVTARAGTVMWPSPA